MRYLSLIGLLSVPLAAQAPPDCNNAVTRDVDVRCACVKDPSSQQCEMVRKGFYEPHDFSKTTVNLGSGYTFTPPASGTPPAARTALPRSQPIRPRRARVVALAHKDYLRFLSPNARLAAGFDFGKLLQSPEVLSALFGQAEGEDARGQILAALKEMDHLWISFAPPNDVVVLMTGKFEQGAAVGMFYAQGIQPVFLGDAHAMMVGSEPSIQAALARLARPVAAGGWVVRRARELSKDHETWIVNETLSPSPDAGPLGAIRQFALGFRIAGQGGLDGEAVADSEADAEKIAAWIGQLKAGIRDKTGVAALDALTVERSGATLKFSAQGDSLTTGEAGKTAMNSDLAVELYSVTMAGFPGMPSRTVAEDKLLAVRTGMKREEVLSLLGKPLSVSSITGLDQPQETWTYQVPFGKQFTLRLDDGVVSMPPHF